MKEETKIKFDKAVEIIVSCWEENNPNSELTFDERLNQRIDEEQDEIIKQILCKARNGV